MQQLSKAKMHRSRRWPDGTERNESRSRRSRTDVTLVRDEHAAELAVAALMKGHQRNGAMKDDAGIAPPSGDRATAIWWWLPLAYWLGGLASYLQLVLICGRRRGSHHG